MNSRKLSFSSARESLASILDGVQKTGEPVTILRRGKPSAVIVSHQMFEQQIRKLKETQWRLAGSIQVKSEVDVDLAIEKGRRSLGKALKRRTQGASGR